MNKRICIAAWILVAAFCASTFAEDGEVLPNGIRLPKQWPPIDVAWGDITARNPRPTPPYLESPPAVIPIDVGRQLFVDDFLVENSTLTRTFHRAEYYSGNPVNPYAMAFSNGVWHDPQDGMFKMWYRDDDGGTGYATSKDGIDWSDGRTVLEGNTDSQCVWLDLESEDPAQRFKMMRAQVETGRRCHGVIYTSPDGIDWTHVGDTGEWGDRSTFFYNPFRKRWTVSARHGWGNPRARRYWEVDDFGNGPYWGGAGQPADPILWTGADALDLPRPEVGTPPELYNLDCVAYESLTLGLFTIWKGDTTLGHREAPQNPNATVRKWQEQGRQKLNSVCLGFSRDGWHWSRPDREAFIPLSEDPQAWNFGNVQSVGGGCLVVGDRLYFYASGRHTRGNTTGLAFLRRDGFASMDAEESGGTLTTRLLKFSGKHLFVNVDGELRVEIVDQDGKVIGPFTRENCRPVKADSTLESVNWEGAKDLSQLAGRIVRLRFHLKSGSLFAFWVSPDESGASHGYVAAGGPGFTGPRDTVGRNSR